MGSGSFDATAYRAYTSTTAGKSVDEVFTSRGMNKNLDPKGIKIRESRDGGDNPKSTPIIVAIDVTGSMGMIAEVLAKQGLGTLFTEILDTKPVTDPHLMFMGIGDAACDSAPLQVSQFEADNRIVEQLAQIYVEGGGGGNSSESYNLPWYFAARHTEHDSFIKRGKRGYLFTVGDEEIPNAITKAQIKKFIGDDVQSDASTQEALEEAQRLYNVFHVVIKEGDYARRRFDVVMNGWNNLLGQHVIPLADHTKLAETIVAAIAVAEGADAASASKKFGSSVLDAVKRIPRGSAPRLALT